MKVEKVIRVKRGFDVAADIAKTEAVAAASVVQHLNDGYCPICGEDAQMGGTHTPECKFSGVVPEHHPETGWISIKPRGCWIHGGCIENGEWNCCGKMATSEEMDWRTK